ncbi:MAG: HAD family hydrolase [Pseudomonadota bacterium]
MTRIRGAVFDKDGTLIDFSASWRGMVEGMLQDYAAGDEALANTLGLAIGYDRRTGLFLPGSPIVADSTDVVAGLIAELLSGPTAAEIEADANRRAAASGAGDDSGVAPVAGLREAINRLKDMELHLGIATHDGEAAARTHASVLGILDEMSYIVGYDSGEGQKPGPGMVLGFCRVTGLAPADIVMVGDSVHDLEAGKSAGVAASVAVLTGPATERELAPLADVVLPSVAELPDYLSTNFPA